MQTTLQRLAMLLKERHWMLATAESCTGGGVATACTDIAGSSEWFDRGFVTYSNAAKQEMLGVPQTLIDTHGAVSEAVVRAMAQGAAAQAKVQVSLATSGIAGPGGGSPDKPVGTVWFAWHVNGVTSAECLHLPGDRHAVRTASTAHALTVLVQLLAAHP